MGRKKKSRQQIESKGEPYHRVHIASFRPPVGGFKTFKEAYLFARNNLKVAPGVDKEEAIRKAIDTYQPTGKSTTLESNP